MHTHGCVSACSCYVLSIITRDLSKHLVISVYSYTDLAAGSCILHGPTAVGRVVPRDSFPDDTVKMSVKAVDTRLESHSPLTTGLVYHPAVRWGRVSAMPLAFAGSYAASLGSGQAWSGNTRLHPLRRLVKSH